MYALIFLLALPAFATNYALLVGGAAHFDENEFLDNLSDEAKVFVQKGWQTRVLYDSNYRPSEWNRFPRSVRPPRPGQPDRQFSHANYDRQMDEIAASAKAGDQVSISFTAHGGVMNNKHRIDWHDGRGHWEATNIARSLLDAFDPTVNVFNKVEALLRKGVKVHFNMISCYDGQVMRDVSSLIRRYPNTFCLSTSTAANRSSYSSAEFYLQTIRSRDSVEANVRRTPEPYIGVSSLPQWTELESRALPADAEHEDAYKILCQMHSTPELRPEVEGLMRNVIAAYPEHRNQRGSVRLRAACSEEGRQVMNLELSRQISELSRRHPHPETSVTYAQVPSYFDFDNEGWYFPTGGGSGRRAHGPRAALTLPVDFEQMMYAQEHKPELYQQLLSRVRTNPSFFPAWQAFSAELARLKARHLSMACDEEALQRILTQERNQMLDRTPNRPKACANFRY